MVREESIKGKVKIVCEQRSDEGLRTFADVAIGTIRTIEAGGGKRVIENNDNNLGYRIRKLTPKECWRLMGFSDQNFENAKEALNKECYNGKDKSNSQLYKQAGNSIVVDVLYYIYKELYAAMPYLFDDLKVGSYFSGIGAFELALDRLFEDVSSNEIGGGKESIIAKNHTAFTVASRGRYNPDGSISQNLEVRTDELTNTITTVQKDNLVIA